MNAEVTLKRETGESSRHLFRTGRRVRFVHDGVEYDFKSIPHARHCVAPHLPINTILNRISKQRFDWPDALGLTDRLPTPRNRTSILGMTVEFTHEGVDYFFHCVADAVRHFKPKVKAASVIRHRHQGWTWQEALELVPHSRKVCFTHQGVSYEFESISEAYRVLQPKSVTSEHAVRRRLREGWGYARAFDLVS